MFRISAGLAAQDPIWGMTVAIASGSRHAEFQDKSCHFCSEKCQTKFKGDPWFDATGRAAGREKECPKSARQEATAFEAITGKGIGGQISGCTVAFGNPARVGDFDINMTQTDVQADAQRCEGKTVMVAAVDGVFAGIVAVVDPIKDSMAQAIKALHHWG